MLELALNQTFRNGMPIAPSELFHVRKFRAAKGPLLMKSLSLALGALAIAMLPASSALADTFDFNFAGAEFSGSGTFTATYQSGDEWLITGITGSLTDGINTAQIDSLLAPGTYPTGTLIGPNDNILIYPPELFGTKYFDHHGVGFELVGGIDVNLNDTFGFENAAAGFNGGIQAEELTSVCVTPSPTPEPSSLLFLGTGILGVAGVMRRKMASTTA